LRGYFNLEDAKGLTVAVAIKQAAVEERLK